MQLNECCCLLSLLNTLLVVSVRMTVRTCERGHKVILIVSVLGFSLKYILFDARLLQFSASPWDLTKYVTSMSAGIT